MTSLPKYFPVLPTAIALLALGAGLYRFPLFHVLPLARDEKSPPNASGAVFDAESFVGRFWENDLREAAKHATEISALATTLRENPPLAQRQFGKSSGLGATYFFVRGSGKVVFRERNLVRLAIDGPREEKTIAIRLGPVFGNTVRDGCGLLDVNALPGLQEFNAISAALNAHVEKNVLPLLRERAVMGAVVDFAGCAEAPEVAAEAGEPLLTVVPVEVNLRP